MPMADWRDSAPGLFTTQGSEDEAQTEAGEFKCSVMEILLSIIGLRATEDSETVLQLEGYVR